MASLLDRPDDNALKKLRNYLQTGTDCKSMWDHASKYFDKLEGCVNEVLLQDKTTTGIKKVFKDMELALKITGIYHYLKKPYQDIKADLLKVSYLRDTFTVRPNLETTKTGKPNAIPRPRGSSNTPSPIPENKQKASKQTKQTEHKDDAVQEENKRLTDELSTLRKQMKDLEEEKENELLRLKDEMTTLNKRIKELEEEQENAPRLENTAVDDPDIVHLSDPNRPQKIGVLYSELYDNEWNDAYTQIIPSCDSERKCIGVLLEILKNSFEFCQRKAEEQMKNIIAAISLNNELNKLKATEMKELKHLRRIAAVTSYPTVQQEFAKTIMKSYPYKDLKDESVLRFANKCTELCWYMAVQDPPLWLHWDVQHKEKVNDDMFKPYTNSGTKVDFLVWPVLKMHRRGVVLAEGVCQLIQNVEQ